ncbi:MAG TPA: iron ABC transporter permease [Polyangiaceae bacterium]|jgi:iron complex transport system permease protein
MKATVARSLALAVLALVLACAVGLAIGTSDASLTRALADASSNDRVVVFSLRLPRVLLGAVAGSGLAAVGVAFQAILRNPLAEPYILGVSGGAALGATIAIACGVASTTLLGAEVLPIVALVSGLGATAFVYALARRSGASSSSGASILLAGVVVNAVASAAITFLKTLVPERVAQDILFWLVGFLDTPASPAALPLVAMYVAIGAIVLLRDAGRLNLLALGSEQAGHLGVDVGALERRTLVACSLVVGAIVSVTGLIGFVGLIVPHVLRRLLGPDVRLLLPVSLPAGAAALVACDALSRLLFHALHTTPPVGAVTALIGGPLFLVLLRRRVIS